MFNNYITLCYINPIGLISCKIINQLQRYNFFFLLLSLSTHGATKYMIHGAWRLRGLAAFYFCSSGSGFEPLSVFYNQHTRCHAQESLPCWSSSPSPVAAGKMVSECPIFGTDSSPPLWLDQMHSRDSQIPVKQLPRSLAMMRTWIPPWYIIIIIFFCKWSSNFAIFF